MAPSQPLVDRSDFPALEQYIYLNSASISLMPTPALHAMEAYERGILHAGTVSLDEEAEVLARRSESRSCEAGRRQRCILRARKQTTITDLAAADGSCSSTRLGTRRG